MDQQVLTIDQFGDMYGAKRTKIYSEINEGRLKAIKLGRRTLIPKKDAEEWFNNLPSYKNVKQQGGVNDRFI